MKTEISAGGLVIRRYQSDWQVLIMKDMSQVWTFPKGKLETGESKQNAAEREIEEEVGLTSLVLLGELPTVKYKYKRKGNIDKTVYYFLFHYKGSQKPIGQKEEGITAVRWVSLEKASQIIGYPKSNSPLIAKAEAILSSL
jgi:mutator protein MutT